MELLIEMEIIACHLKEYKKRVFLFIAEIDMLEIIQCQNLKNSICFYFQYVLDLLQQLFKMGTVHFPVLK